MIVRFLLMTGMVVAMFAVGVNLVGVIVSVMPWVSMGVFMLMVVGMGMIVVMGMSVGLIPMPVGMFMMMVMRMFMVV